jgi:antitoxin VapB
MTQAVKTALAECLQRVGAASTEERERRVRAVLERGRRFRALPVLDRRSPDDMIGYDEHGLPG